MKRSPIAHQPFAACVSRLARLAITTVLILASSLSFAEATEQQWIYPAIEGFGAMHPRDDVAVWPDPKEDYRVFVDIVSEDSAHALDRLARILNVMAYAKVPADHLHVVALLNGKSMMAALTNDAYKARNDGDNPDLAAIHALKEAGVDILVCSQAMAGKNIPDDAIDPAVTITLSGVTDAVIYGHKGYSYMQL